MPSGVGSNLTLASAVLSARKSGIGPALRNVLGVGVPYEPAMTGTPCVPTVALRPSLTLWTRDHPCLTRQG
eukprot:2674459-Prymnesium_polylepis.1